MKKKYLLNRDYSLFVKDEFVLDGYSSELYKIEVRILTGKFKNELLTFNIEELNIKDNDEVDIPYTANLSNNKKFQKVAADIMFDFINNVLCDFIMSKEQVMSEEYRENYSEESVEERTVRSNSFTESKD